MNVIVDEVVQFIENYLDVNRPVLIGLSGGPDSLALFEALHAYAKLDFAAAHVDHGWRKTSEGEAKALKEYVEGKQIKFHLSTIDPNTLQGNLENACRDLRYAFFKELCESYGYQGVMTGHHGQDQAETILKRILEGASLSKLVGIQPVRIINGVKVFRPLLNLEKRELQQSIESSSFPAIHDPSNENPNYLRARMRTAIIPQLERQFGKKVSSNLLLFGKGIQEVNEYLDEKVGLYLSDVVNGAMGSYLPLNQHKPNHRLEFSHLLKTFLAEKQISLTRSQMDTLIELLARNAANKIIIANGQTLYIDRGVLFVTLVEPTDVAKVKLKEGEQTCGSWKVSVSEGEVHKPCSWEDSWRGSLSVSLPPGDYSIGLVHSDTPYMDKSSIAKWWSKHKVPLFFKKFVPVIWKNDEIVHEFLTGNSISKGNLLVTLDISKVRVKKNVKKTQK